MNHPSNRPGPADIEELFTYHPPHADQIPKYTAIRDGAKTFAKILMEHLPECADRSAAIRKLRECVHMANAAVALDPEYREKA